MLAAKICLPAMLFQLAVVFSSGAQSAAAPPGFEQRDRSLLKAMDHSEAEPWRKAITPDFIFVTEASEVIQASEFLQALAPSGAGEQVPAPEIRDYTVSVRGQTAIIVFFLWETGEHLGSALTGHSLVTETWQRMRGSWKLRMVHITSVPVPPPEVKLTAAEIHELEGKYKAGNTSQTISSQGDRLFVASDGGAVHEVKAEAFDLLFTPRTPRMRMVFQRDPVGQISGFAYRNENRSVYFHRVR